MSGTLPITGPNMVDDLPGLHIVFIGNSGIGQSTMIKSFRGPEAFVKSQADIEDPFFARMKENLEHQSMITDVVLEGNERQRIRFTDSSGMECFDRLRKPMLRTAHCICVCFSIADPQSLEGVKQTWMPLLRSILLRKEDDERIHTPIILVGLQSDKRESQKNSRRSNIAEAVLEAVPLEACHEVAEEIGAIGYMECSAFDQEEIEQVRMKAMETAKEASFFRAQEKRVRQAARAEIDQQMFGAGGEDLGVDDVDKFTGEALNAEEDIRPLLKSEITQNLSCLGVCPNLRHAYLRCDISSYFATSMEALREYVNLQNIDLSDNRLRTLEPLGELPFLTHLNASRNLLVRTQSFGPPRHLESCDLSYNMIADLGEWECHRSLKELNLRGNFIERIGTGLRRNYQLKLLDLSENHIMRIENLEDLPIEALYLAQNQLTKLEGLIGLKKLTVLNVRGNFLSVLQPLLHVKTLRKLSIAENDVTNVDELRYIPESACDLYVAPNPIVELPYYRYQVLRRLPKIRVLDNDELITEQEKVKADVLYDDYVEAEETIFNKHLPAEEFVDRRLITIDQVQAMELEMFGQAGMTQAHGSSDDLSPVDQ